MGPNVQMPAAVSHMFEARIDNGQVSLSIKPEWAGFFRAIQQIATASSRSGVTASRPTEDFPGRYEGMPYLDTTLGFPVFLLHASSNVWVDAQGNVV